MGVTKYKVEQKVRGIYINGYWDIESSLQGK